MSRRTSAPKVCSNRPMQRFVFALAAFALLGPLPAVAADAPNGKPKSALAPAAPTRDPDAPPEGAGPGGLDFGAWRSAAPQRTAGAFASEVARLAAAGDVREGLVRNGFECFDPRRPGVASLCVRSALEGACGYDWTVEVRLGATPASRFEAHCLPARPTRK